MSWEAITVTAVAGMKVYDIGKKIGIWDRMRAWLTKKRRILVLGASGSGKSQLVNSIMNPLGEKLGTHQRTVAIERRKTIIDKYPFVFSDTPGQVLDKDRRKIAINEAVRDRIEGVLNVVSFGYHEAAEANMADAIPKRGHRIANLEYLEDRQQIEQSLLSEWVPFFDTTSIKWVLTAVTKADLWWPERIRVEKYYTDGTYSHTLGALRPLQTVLPFCSIIEPFYGRRTSGIFGEHLKTAFRIHLLDSLLRLCGIER